MFRDRQLWRQRQQLNLARNAIIEQNLSAPAARKVSQMDLQILAPAGDRRLGIMQTDPVGFLELRGIGDQIVMEQAR